MSGEASIFKYDSLPETKKVVLGDKKGPSTLPEEASNPKEAEPQTWSVLPSFVWISTTEDKLPPYLAGKSPLYSVTS